jgi:hypothetical protein
MPELRRATDDIDLGARRFEARRAMLSRFRRQVAATDALLPVLERMNLEDRECLGPVAARRITQTLDVMPPSLRLAVGPKTRVQRALELVFDVQAVLFSVRRRRPRPPRPPRRWDRP